MPNRDRRSASIRGAGLVVVAAMLALPATPHAQSRWTIEVTLGNAANVPLPIDIRQRGEAPIELRPRWATRGFARPLYYAVRLTHWKSDEGWALELVHHKLHLENPPSEVQSLSVSHGYNLLLLERRHRAGGVSLTAGAGLVIAHPESRIRGESHDETRGLFGAGYYATGPAALLSASADWRLGGGALGLAEIGVSGARANVPVARGRADLPNLALHARMGVGWDRARK
jgi:hypothetical protein